VREVAAGFVFVLSIPDRFSPTLRFAWRAFIVFELVLVCDAVSVAQTTPVPVQIGKTREGDLLTDQGLVETIRDHQLWTLSQAKAGKAADLSGAELLRFKLYDLFIRALKQPELKSFGPEVADLRGFDLRKATLTLSDISGLHMPEVHLEGATLLFVDAHNTTFKGGHFNGVFMNECDFKEARFVSADLSGLHTISTDFRGAMMLATNLTGAMFFHAKLKDANFSGANLTDVIYQPDSGEIPSISSLATANGLDRLRFNESELGLVELRDALEKAGLSEPQRQVNYSLQRQRWQHRKDSGKPVEAWFHYILFDFTCRYGMSPTRPLQILAALIFILAVPYSAAILIRKRFKRSGIWVVRTKDAVNKPDRRTRAVPIAIQPWTAPTWSGRLKALLRAVTIALFFSLTSAFSLGYGQFNVGTWISQVQPREHTFRGTGWVRSLAGLQSLLSVYLVALWVITYFGKPFDW
jgi:uncharacterized protein YjbI with pentapeptide repeats